MEIAELVDLFSEKFGGTALYAKRLLFAAKEFTSQESLPKRLSANC